MHSERIQLLACNRELIKVILTGEPALAKHLGIRIPELWTEFGTEMYD